MDPVVGQVIAYWTRIEARRGRRLDLGVTSEALAAFEAAHRVHLPAAFRRLYGAADGGGGGDVNLLRFWPLAEVAPYAPAGDGPRDVVFADYLIFSHQYALRLGPDPAAVAPVLWLCDPPRGAPLRIEIAPTFGAFLAAYAGDPTSVLFPPEVSGGSQRPAGYRGVEAVGYARRLLARLPLLA